MKTSKKIAFLGLSLTCFCSFTAGIANAPLMHPESASHLQASNDEYFDYTDNHKINSCSQCKKKKKKQRLE